MQEKVLSGGTLIEIREISDILGVESGLLLSPFESLFLVVFTLFLFKCLLNDFVLLLLRSI